MDKLNDWAVKNLGDWTLQYFGFFVILAAVLAVLLIFVLLIMLVRHIKIAQKIKKLKAEAQQAREGAQGEVNETALRAEIENKVRAELEEEYGEKYKQPEPAANDAQETQMLRAQITEMSFKIDELNDSVREKQNRIDELTAALENADPTTPADNADLYRTINELDQRVKEQENELNLLRAENSQIKAQAMQKQLAEKDKAESAAAEAKKPTKKQPEKVDEPDEEDEYDEYYDDYGDASSAVKVTLKFDRLKNNWVILRSDTDRTYRRMATKQEALVVAKDLARRLHAQLAVHKKDGKFQKV